MDTLPHFSVKISWLHLFESDDKFHEKCWKYFSFLYPLILPDGHRLDNGDGNDEKQNDNDSKDNNSNTSKSGNDRSVSNDNSRKSYG